MEIERLAKQRPNEFLIVEVPQRDFRHRRDDDDAFQQGAPLGFQKTDDLESIQPRKHEVEKDGVVIAGAKFLLRFGAVNGDVAVETFAAKNNREESADTWVVVDDEDHGKTHFARGAVLRLSVCVRRHEFCSRECRLMQTSKLRQNLLLNALPEASFEAVAGHFKIFETPLGKRLFDQDTRTDVYFPLTAVISLIRNLEDGDSLEVSMIGAEGLVGISAVLGVDVNPVEGLTQGAGLVASIGGKELRRLMDDDPTLRNTLHCFVYTMIAHISQLACCNRLHVVEQRLAHWLLLLQDRAGSDDMPMTQEFLGRMLSTRRAGINAAMKALELAGTIEHERGRVRVIDRTKLEQASCECYRAMFHEYERALGFPPVVTIAR
jgi:CRP-like cAMP-binding protein